MSLYPELDGLPWGDLVARFAGPAPEGEESLFYDEVALAIREHGAPGTAFLLDQIGRTDDLRLEALLLALTTPQFDQQPRLRDTLLGYLTDERPAIVAAALDGLWRQGERDVVDTVLAMASHRSPWVRGAVLRYMSRLHPDSARPLLVAALSDPDFIVRENAIDELDELDDGPGDAMPLIRSLLTDPHPHVRQAAQTALEHWAGDSPEPTGATPVGRRVAP